MQSCRVGTQSLSSGAHSRDPLALPPYEADAATRKSGFDRWCFGHMTDGFDAMAIRIENKRTIIGSVITSQAGLSVVPPTGGER
jgi:hypothetical protein